MALKVAVVRAIANTTAEHALNQAAVLAAGGVECVMSATQFDATQPFLREWAVFALRSLTDGNADVREHMAALKVQGVAKETQWSLDELGVKATLQANGKVHVDQTDVAAAATPPAVAAMAAAKQAAKMAPAAPVEAGAATQK
jgi:hypothetical protein